MTVAEDAHYVELRQRVSGLEDGVRAIGVQIGELSKALNERAKTPWATLAAFGGLILVVVKTGGDLSLAPIIQGVERNRQDIAAVVAGLVPRGEHEERWRSLGAEDDNLQRQIDAIDDAFGGTWSIRDGLETINQRLDRYDQRLSALEGAP